MGMAGAKMPWKPTTHSGVIVIHSSSLLIESTFAPETVPKSKRDLSAPIQIYTEGILACFRYCIVCICSFLAYSSKSRRPRGCHVKKTREGIYMSLDSMHIRHVISVSTASTAPAALSQIR
jgi:hypothetical protein